MRSRSQVSTSKRLLFYAKAGLLPAKRKACRNSTTWQQGQALVALLVFMIVAITTTSASVSLMIINSSAAGTVESGARALAIAESGAENALLMVLRAPTTYTGETLTVGAGRAIVVVSGTNTKTIVSRGEEGSYLRTVKVIAELSNGMWTITSWREDTQ